MTTNEMYQQLGISPEVLDFGQRVLDGLDEEMSRVDDIAEYNQAKVLSAMHKNRLNATHFNLSSGYGYDDEGRDNLERVYADVFHTEAALVRPQITCGTHALALALGANLLPGDELLGEVQTALSAERLRPLCDKIVVRAPVAVDYSVNATLTLFSGSNPAEVLAAANAAWAAYEAGRRHRLGADIVPLDIQAALRVAGVYNVSTPGLALTTVAANQWARCTRITITAASEQVDG